jgi:hypothetical protein
MIPVSAAPLAGAFGETEVAVTAASLGGVQDSRATDLGRPSLSVRRAR